MSESTTVHVEMKELDAGAGRCVRVARAAGVGAG